MMSKFLKALALGVVLVVGVAGCAATPPSNTVALSASLTGASEVPANATPGTGSLEATFNKDTSVLTWKLSYSGLTGPATAAHFHGPAVAGSNAGVVIPFASPASRLKARPPSRRPRQPTCSPGSGTPMCTRQRTRAARFAARSLPKCSQREA